MSKENVELLQRPMSARSFTRTWSSSRSGPRRRAPIAGLPVSRGSLRITGEVFDTFEPHVELRDLGDRVLAWGAVQVRARQSGVDMEIATGGVYEVRDHKIVRWQDFGSKAAALKAVGLAE
jgi:ketosteroid isomerase-like protein